MSLSSTIVQLIEPISNRMHRFTTDEACGKWNELLLSDFQRDASFVHQAGSLHDAAIAACFDECPPTRDGFGIVNCDIVHTYSLTLRFHIYLFTDSQGHSVSPAQYTLTGSADDFTAEYRCGLKDQNGQFWYPRTDRSQGRNDPFPEYDEEWALVVRMDMGHGLRIGRRQR